MRPRVAVVAPVIRTWMVELAIVGAVMCTVAIVTDGLGVELIGALAVTASFAHAQVADRLAEAEAQRRERALEQTRHVARFTLPELMDEVADQNAAVHCYRWAARYFTTKEALWFVYFVAHRSWSALVGVGLFLLYPIWRRWWRRR